LSRLTIGQYALLAGVTQAPSIYDPTVNPSAAAARRSHVLQTMLGHGLISKDQVAAAEAEPVLAAGSGC
jgi:membrane peptidoglycan carboxypeptidase